MPEPTHSRFRIVELVRLFTTGPKGHPAWGLLALLIVTVMPVVIGRILFHG